MWQHSKVGPGEFVELKNNNRTSADIPAKYVISKMQLPMKRKTNPYNQPGTQDTTITDEDSASGDRSNPANESSTVTFRCHNQACDRLFRTYEQLEAHNLAPSCSSRKYSQSIYQYISTVSKKHVFIHVFTPLVS